MDQTSQDKQWDHNDASKDQRGDQLENAPRISFELNATKEFTRVLRAKTAKTSQAVTEREIQNANVENHRDIGKVESSDNEAMEVEVENADDHEQYEVTDKDESLAELSKRIKPETEQAFGSTGSIVGVGRGLSNVLSMLKSTGESSKAGAREELRGRAKDVRTYEDYEALLLNWILLD